MKSNYKIAVLGGDLRQYYAAVSLCDHGWHIGLWGMEKPNGGDSRIEYKEELEMAINGADVWLLPLPSVVSGNMLNCPLHPAGIRLKLAEILSRANENIVIVGGKIPAPEIEQLTRRGIRTFDYFSSERFQIKNAYTTAEAALSIAMNSLDKEIRGAKIAITGYGRISKQLCLLLKALGANVTVAARKDADLAWAETIGVYVMPIGNEKDRNTTLKAFETGYDIIYNTVPAWLFDKAFLENVSKKTLLIELASAPGGIDVCAAKELASNVLWAASLPGKYAPQSAGLLIADCVNKTLEEVLL